MTVAPRYEAYPHAIDTGLEAPVLVPLPRGGGCAYAPARLFLETRAGVARVFVAHPAFEARKNCERRSEMNRPISSSLRP